MIKICLVMIAIACFAQGAEDVAYIRVERALDALTPDQLHIYTEEQRGNIAMFRGFLDTGEGRKLAEKADSTLRRKPYGFDDPTPEQIVTMMIQLNANKGKHPKWAAFGRFAAAATVGAYCYQLENKPLIQYTAQDAANLQRCRIAGY